VRVRLRRPFLLVAVALALPVMHARSAAAATGPREHAALLELFATDAALARARQGEQTAEAQLASVRGNLQSVRARLAAARANQQASQRALGQRLNEIYRSRPLDALAVILEARSWGDASAGLDLLDRLSQQDSELVRAARRWHSALLGQSRSLRSAEARASAQQAVWQGRVAALQAADNERRTLVAQLRRDRVHALPVLAATAKRAVARAQNVDRPEPHGGGSATTPVPSAPPKPSLATGTTLSVASTAYSLPGHTASGLPVGIGVCATDPRVIPLGTRFSVPGYGPCVAADTGSAVIGDTIDVWLPAAQAATWGRQTVTITFR
jgi:3D (Asp-Asp-Asp) domain-containing protein